MAAKNSGNMEWRETGKAYIFVYTGDYHKAIDAKA
jgi:hypothetical protein